MPTSFSNNGEEQILSFQISSINLYSVVLVLCSICTLLYLYSVVLVLCSTLLAEILIIFGTVVQCLSPTCGLWPRALAEVTYLCTVVQGPFGSQLPVDCGPGPVCDSHLPVDCGSGPPCAGHLPVDCGPGPSPPLVTSRSQTTIPL